MTAAPRAAAPIELVAERVRAVPDPELPVVTLGDLGVVRSVAATEDGTVEVVLTPTFLGCPALPAIEADVRAVLADHGHPQGRVRQVLAPAWSSELITAEGRRKLAEHGVAPPDPAGTALPFFPQAAGPACPHCGAGPTRPQSPFGATRCQQIMVCTRCRETFPQLKSV